MPPLLQNQLQSLKFLCHWHRCMTHRNIQKMPLRSKVVLPLRSKKMMHSRGNNVSFYSKAVGLHRASEKMPLHRKLTLHRKSQKTTLHRKSQKMPLRQKMMTLRRQSQKRPLHGNKGGAQGGSSYRNPAGSA